MQTSSVAPIEAIATTLLETASMLAALPDDPSERYDAARRLERRRAEAERLDTGEPAAKELLGAVRSLAQAGARATERRLGVAGGDFRNLARSALEMARLVAAGVQFARRRQANAVLPLVHEIESRCLEGRHAVMHSVANRLDEDPAEALLWCDPLCELGDALGQMAAGARRLLDGISTRP